METDEYIPNPEADRVELVQSGQYTTDNITRMFKENIYQNTNHKIRKHMCE
jgi:hypothetical protein